MTPTFYVEKPHPPAEMFGVLGYERIKREHAKAWAVASPDVRAEAKQYADHVLQRRSWSRPAMPKKLLTEQESKRLHLWIHASTDHTEELVASSRVAELSDFFTPTEGCEYSPGMGIVELNLDQRFPLMPECLAEHDCKCHRPLPDSRSQRPSKIPNCIVASSEISLVKGDSALESDDSPRPARDKGKGVNRGTTASGTPNCTAVASSLVSCSKNACVEVNVSSAPTVTRGNSAEDEPAASEVVPNGAEDDVSSGAADAPSVSPAPAPIYSDARRAYPGPGPSNLMSSTTVCLAEDIEKCKDASPTAPVPVKQRPAAASGKSTKVYTCQWSKYFGGSCNYTANTAQSHDRHIVTHVPDEDGYQVAQHKCTICGREFARKCSFQRHGKSVHKEDDPDRYWEEATRPWYWPELLFVSESMKMKPRAEQPTSNELTCLEKIGQILDDHKIDSAMRRASDEGVVRNTKHSHGRPTKRRKTG